VLIYIISYLASMVKEASCQLKSDDWRLWNHGALQVDIWEERRVFGSRAQGLREELLGKNSQLHGHEGKHFAVPPYQVTLEVFYCIR
jgi:hypothetical protein